MTKRPHSVCILVKGGEAECELKLTANLLAIRQIAKLPKEILFMKGTNEHDSCERNLQNAA